MSDELPGPSFVRTQDLRRYFECLIDHLEKNGHKEIDLSADYYWDISLNQWTNLDVRPSDITLGQLSEEISRLEEMVAQGGAVGYGFVWLGALLRRVGQLRQS